MSATSLNCPVCPAKELPPGSLHCPNCNADLSLIHRLREVPDGAYNDALALLGSGRFDDAIVALDAALTLGGDAGKLNLLAGKILRRAGRGHEAVSRWRRIPSGAAEASEAEALIREADQTESSGSPPRRIALVGFGIVAGGIVGAAVALWLMPGAGHAEARRTLPAASAPARAAQLAATAQPGSGVGTSSASAGREDPLAVVERELRESGDLRIERDGNRLSVLFAQGVFPAGSIEMGTESVEHIKHIALLLHRTGVPQEVTVRGFADANPPGPASPWKDNWSLAFDRAGAAVHCLKQGVPNDARITWLAAGSADEEAPFPNDTVESRNRNRTIRLQVVPRI